MIVVDASLAVKLVVREADSAAAHHWYNNIDTAAVAPDILAIEVAQAIVRRVNMREAIMVDGRGAIREWRTILDGGAIELFRTAPAQMEAAAELALALGHPIKDCLYLALALDLGADLMTCDARFAAKARVRYPAVRLLADHA